MTDQEGAFVNATPSAMIYSLATQDITCRSLPKTPAGTALDLTVTDLPTVNRDDLHRKAAASQQILESLVGTK